MIQKMENKTQELVVVLSLDEEWLVHGVRKKGVKPFSSWSRVSDQHYLPSSQIWTTGLDPCRLAPDAVAG